MNHKEIEKVYYQIEEVSKPYGLSLYENNIFKISSDQMIEMYISGGIPIYFSHWSFGKRYAEQFELYKNNKLGLAYEIIAATNPCTSYLMENNPDLIQKLVIAHACFGHNHFFKNNYLFSSVNILPYSEYARDFINECRSKYGEVEVDQVLDNCLILQWFGVDENSNYNFGDFLKTRIKHKFQDSWELDYLTPLSNNIEEIKTRNVIDTFKNRENLLDIFSVYSELDPWKKEIISIISTFSKFFWKNILTKVINEGFASFIHYKIMNEMQLSQSEHLQFLDTHTSVVSQQEFGPAYKINPYYLGFHILMELEKTKGLDFIVNNVVKNYRDDNFIEQFLSKELMEDKLKLMMAVKHASEDDSILYKVTEIQDDDGFSILKKTLINELSYNNWKPEVLIDSINTINHSIKIKLSNKGAILNLSKLKNSLKALWGEGEVSFI